MNPPVPPQQEPVSSSAGVIFRPDAAKRIGEATRFVERMRRNPKPRAAAARGLDTNGRYAFLAPGALITGIAGATLGHGTVQFCSVDPGSYAMTADGDSVVVLNAGGDITGVASTGTFVKLGWANGMWSVDVVLCG